MIKRYLGLVVVVISMTLFGCTSNDDGADNADAGVTDSANENVTDGMDAGVVTGTDGTTAVGGETEGTEGTTDSGTVVDQPPRDFGNSVMGILAAQPDLTLFEAAVLAAEGGLDDTLHDANNEWTVFAPNDTAMEGVTANREDLLRHIHAGSQSRDSLTGLVGGDIGMTGGPRQAITMAEDGVTLQIGGANIVQSAIVGDNGVVFKIDGILQP